MTYFHAVRHYHRPHELNGRVRNGNVCFLMRMVTGLVCFDTSFAISFCEFKLPTVGRQARFQNKVVKLSSISIGQLRPLLALHLRPIDLIVCQGTSGLLHRNLILGEASRLYAFSAYPDRT